MNREQALHEHPLIVVSNRGSYTLAQTAGGLAPRRTVGGLVAAVEPVLQRRGGVWISWLGRLQPPGGGNLPPPVHPPGLRYAPDEVVLGAEELHGYYEGFANGCLWPLTHGFLEKCRFDPPDWEAYQRVNARFADRTARHAAGGGLVWVHDFQLALVPALVRQRVPGAPLALFWHVPFPPPEVFEALPWARPVLEGMLGSDQVDFHTPAYAANFIDCVRRLLGAQVDPDGGTVSWQGRTVRVRALPLGIDCSAFVDLVRRPEVQEQAEAIRRDAGAEVLLLGLDRLDYSKGIPQRLEALETLLEQWPEARGRLTLLQVAVPSRGGVAAYQELRRQVEALVGRINGRFGSGRWQPVLYRSRPLGRREVVAHYLAADVALVTPLRDGLNLVAKEYAVCRLEGRGVLVLSRFAGAAAELGEALLVNPYHKEGLAAAIRRAAEMPAAEQARRLEALQAHIRHDLAWWWQQVHQSLSGLSRESRQGVAAG